MRLIKIFELFFMKFNEKGVIEAISYNIDMDLNSKKDLKYTNKFIMKHLEFYKTGAIRIK